MNECMSVLFLLVSPLPLNPPSLPPSLPPYLLLIILIPHDNIPLLIQLRRLLHPRLRPLPQTLLPILLSRVIKVNEAPAAVHIGGHHLWRKGGREVREGG